MEGACGRVRSGCGRRVSAALPRPDEAGRRGGRATERWTRELRSGMSAYAPEETSASSQMKWARSTARKAACVPRYHASVSGAGAARTGEKRGRSEARAAAPQRRSCGWCRSETSCARARRLVRESGAICTIPCFSCRAVGGNWLPFHSSKLFLRNGRETRAVGCGRLSQGPTNRAEGKPALTRPAVVIKRTCPPTASKGGTDGGVLKPTSREQTSGAFPAAPTTMKDVLIACRLKRRTSSQLQV